MAPRLGDVRLCDLSAGQLSAFDEELRESGRCRKPREGRSAGLSERTIHAIHVTLIGSLGYAVEASAPAGVASIRVHDLRHTRRSASPQEAPSR